MQHTQQKRLWFQAGFFILFLLAPVFDLFRFEEQELFPAAERAVPGGLLEAALASQDELAKTDNLLSGN